MSHQPKNQKRIAILGAGPSGLFAYKHLLETGSNDFTVDIFETTAQLGGGMPYSTEGANAEHITNVSCNEIPPLVTSIREWLVTQPASVLERFHLEVSTFNEHKVLPRLLFGKYLADQFDALRQRANEQGVPTTVHLKTQVTDLIDQPGKNTVLAEIGGTSETSQMEFDCVIVCIGHNWPHANEGRVTGYFDSPYPPAKLANRYNHPIAIRGSSLTAVDAIRTLARCNGAFSPGQHGMLKYEVDDEAPDFKIIMHSRHGILPCIRFHTDTPQVGKDSLISEEDLAANMAGNAGFLSLNFIFEKNFKEPLREKDPKFFERIRNMTIEQFVEDMLSLRESVDAFVFFKSEYAEAQKSIRRHESIYWKEMLSALSFAMNYPAKHMSAEDMYRHQHVLMPLISIVIAFVPQSSCQELLALHEAGRLELVSVEADSHVDACVEGGALYHYRDADGTMVQTRYETFIDCVGQPRLPLSAFPFKSMISNGSVTPARLRFASTTAAEQMKRENDKDIARDIERDADGEYYLRLSGLAITDDFEVVGKDGVANSRIFMMAVPYMGGYNPDYSGLDFCEEAGGLIAARIFQG